MKPSYASSAYRPRPGERCAYRELHALGSGSSQLAGHNNLATLGTRLHDEAQDTVACPSHGQTVEQFVSEGLALSDGRETSVLHLGGIQRHAVLWELESLLDERCEFSNPSTLLAEDFLGVGGSDDCSHLSDSFFLQLFFLHTDICYRRGDSNFDAGVALLCQFSLSFCQFFGHAAVFLEPDLEELVQLGIEDTVSDELSFLGDGALLGGHIDGMRDEYGKTLVVGVCTVLRVRSTFLRGLPAPVRQDNEMRPSRDEFLAVRHQLEIESRFPWHI